MARHNLTPTETEIVDRLEKEWEDCGTDDNAAPILDAVVLKFYRDVRAGRLSIEAFKVALNRIGAW